VTTNRGEPAAAVQAEIDLLPRQRSQARFLAELTGKEAEKHGVAPTALEGQVGTHKALTDEPATGGNALRGLVVRPAGQSRH
jgi:hypothetical protein